MATLEKVRLSPLEETEQAKAFAARYRCEFVDLREALIDHDLFRSVPNFTKYATQFLILPAQFSRRPWSKAEENLSY